MASVILITGIAPHSVGEAFVEKCSRLSPDIKLICVDRERNRWLEQHVTYYPIQLDLNPLRLDRAYDHFLNDLRRNLESALAALEEINIECVIHCAGVYSSGRFVDASDVTRRTVLGVNLLGHIDVLHTVMAINEDRGLPNSEKLTHIEIGSFQGLQARPGRAMYGTSKAAGVDFAASLAIGNEVARAIYIAPGPVDTYMLHHNHWVVKAAGPEEILNEARSGERDSYRSMFVDCSYTALCEFLKQRNTNVAALDRTFAAYRTYREEAKSGLLGLLTAEECAQLLFDVVEKSEDHPSGVYLFLRTSETGRLRYIEFNELDRLAIARRVWGL